MIELLPLVAVGFAVAFGGIVGYLLGRRAVEDKLGDVSEQLEGRVKYEDLLRRLPEGAAEVRRVSAAINRVLARLSSLQSSAVDQSAELEATQEALRLAEELAAKQSELETRLRERAVLLEVLRASAETQDLEEVLAILVDRVGETLRLDRLVVALRDDAGGLRVRASFGFADPPASGDPVEEPDGGRRGVLVVPDVAEAPSVRPWIDRLDRDCSYVAAPVVSRGEEHGWLILTRPITEPFSEVESRVVEAIADQSAIAIANARLVARLEELATQDELTGLPNRRLFLDHLKRAIAADDRRQEGLCILALDLDHFKQLNDHGGHAAGDEALVKVAEILRTSLREVDTPARAGGEELWVLLPQTKLEGGLMVAEKLRQAIAKIDVPGASEQPLGHLSVSMGVAVRGPWETPEALLRRADQALYEAKAAGRDRVASVEWKVPDESGEHALPDED